MSTISFSPLHISTMTVGYTYPNTIDIGFIKSHTFIEITSQKFAESTCSISGVGDANETKFKNCVFVKIRYAAQKRTFMIFSKGYIQVTGCKSLDDAKLQLSTLISCLPDVELPTVHKENLTCQLINSNFQLNYRFDFDKLLQTFKLSPPNFLLSFTFDKDRHSAVRLAIRPKSGGSPLKVFIFNKGNVVITGGKALVDVQQTYDDMKDFLTRTYKMFTIPKEVENDLSADKKRPGRKKKSVSSSFYGNLFNSIVSTS